MDIKNIIKNVYLILRAVLFSLCFILTFRMRKKKFSKTSVKKIVVISLKRVGDSVVSIPVFRAIKEHYPDAELVVLAKEYIKDMLMCINYIDRIIVLKDESFPALMKLSRYMRKESFDLGVDLHCDYGFMPAFLTYMTGAKYRIGYNVAARGFIFNLPIKHIDGRISIIDDLLNVVRSVGIDTFNKELRLNIPESAMEAARQLLEQKGVKSQDLLIGFHPGGNYKSQCWPKEKFVELANNVIGKYSAKVMFIADSREADSLNYIKASLTQESIIFINQPLKNIIALIKRCDLLVCNNSGPLHIAAAVDTPTVSTLGPTIASRWWPQGDRHIVVTKNIPCQPCSKGSCSTHECMNLITVEEMLEAVDKQIKKYYLNR